METKRKRGVINTAAGINKRAEEVNPLACFGASAMGFPDKISTVRSGMATRHTAQRVVLTDPEFPYMYTGAENEFGRRSTWNVEATHDYQLMKVFRKFQNVPNSPVAYIFKDLETNKYICKIVRPVENLIEKYGFRMQNFMNGHMEGDIIPEGAPIAQSSSYVDGNYCAGRNIRIGATVLPDLTEDALVISDYAAWALRYDMVDKVTVNLGKRAFLLNNYGNETVYKPFPDIGEEIQNGILCSIRENSYLSTMAEASIPHINDVNIWSHGFVVDIDIFSNVEVENEQYNYYLNQIKTWYTNIYSYISTIITDPYQDDTSLLDIYHQAQKYLNDSTWVTKEYIADTIIRFTVLQPKAPLHIGQKVVGRYGNKSVIAKIIKRELMPKTDDGRPIDMLTNGFAIPNRIIAFSPYEMSLTFQAERMHQHLCKMKEDGESDNEIFALAAEFVSVYNPEQADEMRRLYQEHPAEVMKDILTNMIYIQIMPLNDVCIRDAVLECDKRWPDIMKRYHIYTKLRHRWIKSDEVYAVGYQYTWVLKQEPSKALSTVSTGRTTLYDLPIKTRQYNKNLRNYSDNPIKFGEYDTYNFLAGVGIRAHTKIGTYFRGSQYEENSVLMGQLNDMKIDVTKYNKFPQLDNLKNMLKFMGIELAHDIFGYNTIGNVDEEQDILFNNVTVRISIPDLRYVLIMYSYYVQYEAYKNGTVNMDDFLANIGTTDLFKDVEDDEYVQNVYRRFVELIPVLQQLKQYQ